MIKKGTQKSTQLERIPESLSGESDAKPPSAFNAKRVSIATLMNSLQKTGKEVKEEHKEHPTQALKVEEKDRMVRELQQQIFEKKVKNDMIKEAFHRRNESETDHMCYSQTVGVLISGCKILACQDHSFKRAYFRSLLTILKHSGKNRQKAVKSMLIWLISWITKLFTFLSSTLIKK